MKSTRSKMLIYVGVFFALVFAWYGVKKIMFFWFMSHYQPPAVTISASPAKNKTWQSFLNSVGSLSAINGVDLAAEVPGIIKEIHFNSGEMVKKGDVLLRLDTNKEQAELKSNKAKLRLATINYEREKSLFNKKVSSQAMLDTRYAELRQAEASVEAVEAKIQEKIITAPFEGRLGIRLVNLGQYLSPGTSLVTLQSLNPLYVQFNLPEKHLTHLYLNQEIDVVVDIDNSKTIKGKITAINAKVDPSTRNILVQATIPNDHFTLFPGMYANVKIWLKPQDNRVVVPQTAISYSLSGDYIYVVRKEKDKLLHAYRQFVKIGERRSGEVSILEGIKPEDLIVTSGQLKLQNGTTVLIDNSVEL